MIPHLGIAPHSHSRTGYQLHGCAIGITFPGSITAPCVFGCAIGVAFAVASATLVLAQAAGLCNFIAYPHAMPTQCDLHISARIGTNWQR